MRSSITKTIKISYGHLLTNHKGDCSRSHGHNAKIEITISGEIYDTPGESMSGMVMDFGDVKKAIQEAIGRWDHRFLACGDEWNFLLANEHADPDRMGDFVLLGVPTTAENLSKTALKQIQRQLDMMGGDAEYVVESVKWWETDDNCAEYSQGQRRD